MTLDEVMTTLRALGSEQTRKTMRKHGAPDSEDLYFGVLVGDLKPIAKKIKGIKPWRWRSTTRATPTRCTSRASSPMAPR
jgi:hypothetical protein